MCQNTRTTSVYSTCVILRKVGSEYFESPIFPFLSSYYFVENVLKSFQITTEVALILLMSSAILLIVPFKYILGFLLFDVFTRELEFRREMVMRFRTLLKERWDAVPAAPVVVLPYEGDETRAPNQTREIDDIETRIN